LKTIILAGGLGTRISEETENKPKPMVLIDDKPLLWHVMNIYASQGFDDFVIATGYKAEINRRLGKRSEFPMENNPSKHWFAHHDRWKNKTMH